MKKLKLERADLAVKISQKYREEKNARKKVKLLAIKLAAEGNRTAIEIARICDCSRSSLFEWIKSFRSGGFEKLLEEKKPGPTSGERRGISSKVSCQLDEGIATGRWCTVEAARRWLKNEHKIEKKYITMWAWIKKAGRGSEGSASQTPRSK